MDILVKVLAFLGPFLFFLLEMMASNRLLPQFGGSSMVWVASTFFFTVVLLIGYLFVDQLSKYLSRKGLNLLISFLFISIIFFIPLELKNFSSFKTPQVSIFLTLLQNLGIPFFLLSLTTSWSFENVSQLTNNKIPPYSILYYSNLGSLLGLFLGPIFLFNFIPMTTLFKIVTTLFFIFSFIFLILLYQSLSFKNSSSLKTKSKSNFIQLFSWFFPSFVMVVMMLAITNMTTIGIGSSPLIWFIPLGLYLISFILNFSKTPLYSSKIQSRLIILWAFLHFLSIFFNEEILIAKLSYINFYFFLFLVSNALARELYLRRPQEDESGTTYNLALNLGGMFASFFVLFIIPNIDINIGNMNLELFLGTFCFALFLINRDWKKFINFWVRTNKAKKIVSILGIISFLCLMTLYLIDTSKNDIYFKRNFYGINRVLDFGNYRTYINGRTIHGGQFKNAKQESSPLFYYQPMSAAGEYFSQSTMNQNVYAVGLGVGSLAAYSKPNESWTFVDIDADVLDIAQNYFTFIKNAKAKIQLEVGDGRKILEQKKDRYDLIILDAFSNDSIPTHLLTKEAFDIYENHLTNEGKILIHESGNTMKLESIIIPQLLKKDFSWASKKISLKTALGITSSSWIVAFRNSNTSMIEFTKKNLWQKNLSFINKTGWSDDHINILSPILAGLE